MENHNQQENHWWLRICFSLVEKNEGVVLDHCGSKTLARGEYSAHRSIAKDSLLDPKGVLRFFPLPS